jgi:hypothetical protein
VAWLTVSEAAKTLKISEAAVRKRMQRNTLKHSKFSDGRVYVYLDYEESLREHAETKPDSGETPEQETRRWWTSIADISALVAVLAAAIYVLGLFTLWVPIYTTYTHDFEAAWHAASLVPRTLVAGLGVRQLLAFPLLVATIILILTLIADGVVQGLLRRRRKSRDESSGERSAEKSVDGESANGESTRGATGERMLRMMGATMPVMSLVILYAGWRIATSPTPLFQVSPWVMAIIILMLMLILGLGMSLVRIIVTRDREALIGIFFVLLIWVPVLYFTWRALELAPIG